MRRSLLFTGLLSLCLASSATAQFSSDPQLVTPRESNLNPDGTEIQLPGSPSSLSASCSGILGVTGISGGVQSLLRITREGKATLLTDLDPVIREAEAVAIHPANGMIAVIDRSFTPSVDGKTGQRMNRIWFYSRDGRPLRTMDIPSNGAAAVGATFTDEQYPMLAILYSNHVLQVIDPGNQQIVSTARLQLQDIDITGAQIRLAPSTAGDLAYGGGKLRAIIDASRSGGEVNSYLVELEDPRLPQIPGIIQASLATPVTYLGNRITGGHIGGLAIDPRSGLILASINTADRFVAKLSADGKLEKLGNQQLQVNDLASCLNSPMPPLMKSSFQPSRVRQGETTILQVDLSNPNPSAMLLTRDMTILLPDGISVAYPLDIWNNCPTQTQLRPPEINTSGPDTTPQAASIVLKAGTSLPPQGCSVRVRVQTESQGNINLTIPASTLEADGIQAETETSSTLISYNEPRIDYVRTEQNLNRASMPVQGRVERSTGEVIETCITGQHDPSSSRSLRTHVDESVAPDMMILPSAYGPLGDLLLTRGIGWQSQRSEIATLQDDNDPVTLDQDTITAEIGDIGDGEQFSICYRSVTR